MLISFKSCQEKLFNASNVKVQTNRYVFAWAQFQPADGNLNTERETPLKCFLKSGLFKTLNYRLNLILNILLISLIVSPNTSNLYFITAEA